MAGAVAVTGYPVRPDRVTDVVPAADASVFGGGVGAGLAHAATRATVAAMTTTSHQIYATCLVEAIGQPSSAPDRRVDDAAHEQHRAGLDVAQGEQERVHSTTLRYPD